MSELNSNVPLLGQKQTIRANPQTLSALVRTMDENGTFEPETTSINNGQVSATAGRSNMMSGEDLVDEIVDKVFARLKVLIRDEFAYQKTLDK